MQLNVQERFALLSLLPTQGDFVTLRVVRELREALSFSDEEHKRLQFKWVDDGRVTWEASADEGEEFDFGWKQMQIINETLEKADTEKRLKMDELSVYEKFKEARSDSTGAIHGVD